MLSTDQILSAERRSDMTDDEALRFGRAIESMAVEVAALICIAHESLYAGAMVCASAIRASVGVETQPGPPSDSLSRAERALQLAGFVDNGGQDWTPPLGPRHHLTVWASAMPESNGKSNFTAILMRKGGDLVDGFTIARSEYPDRVRYEADFVRHLIGELSERPFLLDYDADRHSGYAADSSAAPSELESLVREYGNTPLFGEGRTRKQVLNDIRKMLLSAQPAPVSAQVSEREAVLLEYFNAARNFAGTVGNESATPEDENKAEERYEAARKAVDAALKSEPAAPVAVAPSPAGESLNVLPPLPGPCAKLHDDGYFTWKANAPDGINHAGWSKGVHTDDAMTAYGQLCRDTALATHRQPEGVLTIAEVWAAIDGQPEFVGNKADVLHTLSVLAKASDACEEGKCHRPEDGTRGKQVSAKTYRDRVKCPKGHRATITRRISSAGHVVSTYCQLCGKAHMLLAGPAHQKCPMS